MMIVADIRVEAGDWPSVDLLEAMVGDCIDAVIAETGVTTESAEAAFLFTDDEHQRLLNAAHRGKDASTNVLSFPAGDMPSLSDVPRLLGDISVAYETVLQEAEAGGIRFGDHLRHLIIHGLLHLLGYDHEDDAEATIMERTETRALARFGIADPYSPNQV